MRTRQLPSLLVTLPIAAGLLASCSTSHPIERVVSQSVQPNAGIRSAWVKKVRLPDTAAPKVHVIVNGEYLSNIAEAELGNPDLWPRLFDANPDIVDPNVVEDGQSVRIPDASEQLAARPLPEPPRHQCIMAEAASRHRLAQAQGLQLGAQVPGPRAVEPSRVEPRGTTTSQVVVPTSPCQWGRQ